MAFTSWVSLQDARPVCEIQDKRTISVVDGYTLLLGTVYVSDATVYFCDYTYEENGIPWTVRRSVNVSVIRKYGRTVAAGSVSQHTRQDERTPIHTPHKSVQMNAHPYTHHTSTHLRIAHTCSYTYCTHTF